MLQEIVTDTSDFPKHRTLGGQLLNTLWDDFFLGLKSLYAALPYGPKEQSVHAFFRARVLMTLLMSQENQCRVEDRQANGLADIVASHPCGVFVFELERRRIRRRGIGAGTEEGLRRALPREEPSNLAYWPQHRPRDASAC